MNAFQLARQYPNAATQTEAIKEAEAEIVGIDLQISALRSKRASLVQLIDYKPSEARASVRVSNRSHRARKDGTTEFLYTNNAYSELAKRLNVGTRDKGQNSCHVWLSINEAEAICDLKNQEDARRDLRLVKA